MAERYMLDVGAIGKWENNGEINWNGICHVAAAHLTGLRY